MENRWIPFTARRPNKGDIIEVFPSNGKPYLTTYVADTGYWWHGRWRLCDIRFKGRERIVNEFNPNIMKVSELLELLGKYNEKTSDYHSIELFADGSGYLKVEYLDSSIYIFPNIEDLINHLKEKV